MKDNLSFDQSSVSEKDLQAYFLQYPALNLEQRQATTELATSLVREARAVRLPLSVEKLMTVYKISAAEGRMLMELAEAMIRVPDVATRNLLITDKLANGHWLAAKGDGFLVGAKYALELAGKIVKANSNNNFKTLVTKLGLPIIRQALQTAIKYLAHQFVVAESIDNALQQSKTNALYSFDMLGEAARTDDDITRFYNAYENSIKAVGGLAETPNIHLNNGVSVKLSALSCRFHTRYWQECVPEITAKLLSLGKLARSYNIPLTIDAEETARLQLTLEIFSCLLSGKDLKGWNGLGFVVQAYTLRATQVIDWLVIKAKQHNVQIAVRLVKGAYWDSEIKIAQEKGLTSFPVFIHKNNTDLSYLSCARKMLEASQNLFPQFASHNAVTLAGIHELVTCINPEAFEVQKLYGMGDAVHNAFSSHCGYQLRVYAPVGKHDDLLSYLVRRLLENSANSSFVNHLADHQFPIKDLTKEPYQIFSNDKIIKTGACLFFPERLNSKGCDIDDVSTLLSFEKLFKASLPEPSQDFNPKLVFDAFENATVAQKQWQQLPSTERVRCLEKIASLYEEHAEDLYQLLILEAFKTFDDAVNELREAVDFCRFYAKEIENSQCEIEPRGVVVAISPWNFPLAIFTGQIVAALVTGNAVLAKPAEQTPLIAEKAVALMHKALVPHQVLQLILGTGNKIGQALTSAGLADMVVFTGSNKTAKAIELALANSDKPHVPLIAETGGINAMIVDSTALIETAVDDIITSAFRSAGQRCSALRVLYVQDDIASPLIKMLIGAAQNLKIGRALNTTVDIGEVIDAPAKNTIDEYVGKAKLNGKLLWQSGYQENNLCCAPAIIQTSGIEAIEQEIFGPILHIATYPTGGEPPIIKAINQKGFGLTFGLHTRIDNKIDTICKSLNIGNIYVNRNQTGAVVGSQPFGGVGLSGTGPKAGGKLYLKAFIKNFTSDEICYYSGKENILPAPDGELNTYSIVARGTVLCITEDDNIAAEMRQVASLVGNKIVGVTNIPDDFTNVDAVLIKTDDKSEIAKLRKLMATSSDKLIPLIADEGSKIWLFSEKHICRDLTASGGNVGLLTQ